MAFIVVVIIVVIIIFIIVVVFVLALVVACVEAKKDTIMDDACADVRNALLSNPKYGEVSGYNASLAEAHKLLKRMNAGRTKVFGPQIMKDMSDAATLGVETVCTTYVIFKVEHEIKLEKSLIARRRAVKELQAAVADKGSSFGGSIDKYCEGLCRAAAKPAADAARAEG